MDKEKQIGEMARDLCRLSCTCEECQTVPSHKKDKCKAKVYAKRAYAKGYRKASEVVRDIFNDLNEMWHKGRGFIKYPDLVRLERLHEQKYTEGGE